MKEKPFKTLDIGGGPDAEGFMELTRQIERRYAIRPEGFESARDSMRRQIQSLRTVQLALQNPDNQYFVLDPFLPTDLVKEQSTRTPNLHFVVGKKGGPDFWSSSQVESLPFADESFDAVEMNFIFTPLKLKELAAKHLVKTIADMGAVYDDWAEERPSDISDAEHYFSTLQDAARTLNAGGNLYLLEKWQRIEWIKNMLNISDPDTPSPFLKEVELIFKEEENIIDPDRTMYTGWALSSQDDAEDKNSFRTPVLLTFEKVSH